MSAANASGSPKRMPPLRAPDLLRALHRHHVEFVVIGGFALAAHAVARATKDLDIVPEPSRANLRRLLAALTELDAAPGEPRAGWQLDPPHELRAPRRHAVRRRCP